MTAGSAFGLGGGASDGRQEGVASPGRDDAGRDAAAVAGRAAAAASPAERADAAVPLAAPRPLVAEQPVTLAGAGDGESGDAIAGAGGGRGLGPGGGAHDIRPRTSAPPPRRIVAPRGR